MTSILRFSFAWSQSVFNTPVHFTNQEIRNMIEVQLYRLRVGIFLVRNHLSKRYFLMKHSSNNKTSKNGDSYLVNFLFRMIVLISLFNIGSESTSSPWCWNNQKFETFRGCRIKTWTIWNFKNSSRKFQSGQYSIIWRNCR